MKTKLLIHHPRAARRRRDRRPGGDRAGHTTDHRHRRRPDLRRARRARRRDERRLARQGHLPRPHGQAAQGRVRSRRPDPRLVPHRPRPRRRRERQRPRDAEGARLPGWRLRHPHRYRAPRARGRRLMRRGLLAILLVGGGVAAGTGGVAASGAFAEDEPIQVITVESAAPASGRAPATSELAVEDGIPRAAAQRLASPRRSGHPVARCRSSATTASTRSRYASAAAITSRSSSMTPSRWSASTATTEISVRSPRRRTAQADRGAVEIQCRGLRRQSARARRNGAARLTTERPRIDLRCAGALRDRAMG